MKRAILVFVVAALVLITTAAWFFSSNSKLTLAEIVEFGVIIMLVAFANFIGAGILAMAIIFALSWLYFNFRGVRNE